MQPCTPVELNTSDWFTPEGPAQEETSSITEHQD